MKSFFEQVQTIWGTLCSQYRLQLFPCSASMVHVVMGSNTVLVLVNHPSHGGVDMLLAQKARNGWAWYSISNFLFRRSTLRPSNTLPEGVEGYLTLFAWKLEESGKDLLEGRESWTQEYERVLGRPDLVLAEQAEDFERVAEARRI